MNSPVFRSIKWEWRNAKRSLRVLAAVIVVLPVVCLPLLSQSSQGAIQGAVFDQSGGSVTDVAISVIDTSRGVTRALVTDVAGQYAATSLNPGTYTIRAEAKGFRTVEHSGVFR